jgi:DNA mismatch endonuclease (patch repair protein)
MAAKLAKPSAERSSIMRAVKSRNTRPEKVVRSFLHARGCRFRLCDTGLPGKPDIVLRARRSVVFVHGCFWHGHDCKRGARVPKTNRAYWSEKIARNVARDALNIVSLKKLGWRVAIVWECQTQDAVTLDRVLKIVIARQRP